MTPFPLSPAADAAPVRSPNRTSARAPVEEKFEVQPVEPVSRELAKDTGIGHTAAPASDTDTVEILTDASLATGPAPEQTTPGASTQNQGLIQSLMATTPQPVDTSNATVGNLASGNAETAQAEKQSAVTGQAVTGGIAQSVNLTAGTVQAPIPQQSDQGNGRTGPHVGVESAVKISTESQIAVPLSSTMPKPTGRSATGSQPDGTYPPGQTAGTDAGERAKSVISVSEIAAGKTGETKSAAAGSGPTPDSTNPANASLTNNPQLLAQAIANTTPDAGTNAAETVSFKPLTPSPVPVDGMTVTQNFNTELRAAIDTPTQTAAMTAKGAVTAQPAADQAALQISRAVGQGTDKLTVHLKPAELGKITIDLEVGHDNRLIAVIAADKSETLDLLQRDARSLERALNDAGLKTDSGSLEFNLRDDGESAQNDSDANEKLFDGAVMLPGAGDDGLEYSPHAQNPLILPEGRIDIQV